MKKIMKNNFKILLYFSIFLFLIGLFSNQWILSIIFSDDHILEKQTKLKIYLFQFFCFFLSYIIYEYRYSLRLKNIFQRFLLVSLSLFFCLAFGEVILYKFDTIKYYVWEPNMNEVHQPAPGLMPGIYGLKRFTTDNNGIRSISRYSKSDYKILTIGGSTTECLYLDDHETWAAVLENNLNQGSSHKYWVGNVGQSGMNTRHHILHVKYLLPQFPEVDAILLFVGINDLSYFLRTNKTYSINQILYSNEILEKAFSRRPKTKKVDFLNFREYHIYFLVMKAFYILTNKTNYQDKAGSSYKYNRLKRINSDKVSTLPSLEKGLNEYRDNINYIIDICRKNDVKIILATQPTMWFKNMPKRLSKLLWFGWTDNDSIYYNSSSLADAMAQYNKIIRNIAIENDIQLVDLSNSLPKDTTVFYDDCHFNERGALLFGEYISNSIKQSISPERNKNE